MVHKEKYYNKKESPMMNTNIYFRFLILKHLY